MKPSNTANLPKREETTVVDYARAVRGWGEGIVSTYLDTRDRSDAHRSVKSLIEETTREYGGRFLLELLQNAHDAHDRATADGAPSAISP